MSAYEATVETIFASHEWGGDTVAKLIYNSQVLSSQFENYDLVPTGCVTSFTFSSYRADIELQRFSHCSAVFRFSILKEVVLILVLGFPGASGVKNPPASAGDMSSIGKIPWRRKCQRPLVFLPREFHGQRSLAGHSPWGHKVLDRTEQLRQKQENTPSTINRILFLFFPEGSPPGPS